MSNLTLRLALLAIGLAMLAPGQAAKFEELALTPPMGWNSWNTFGCDIDENMIREMADVMVSSGMRDAGYEYVNLDDCWHGQRDADGNIQVDPERFPSGMQALADYVHGRGLKIGIYSDAGWRTCAGRPGSRGYEFQDARQYARWGIDYLKYDWCNTDGLRTLGAYLTMREALYAAGRPVVFSICEWGNSRPWEWGGDVGHSWRISGDITPCWNCEERHGEGPGAWSSWGVLRILDMRDNAELRQYAGPGRWNDMDMLEVGNGMSAVEDRSHLTLWALLASPLLAGNDLRTMTDETRAILTNPDIIAISQDPLGVQAFRYAQDGEIEVWFRPLSDGHWAMGVLNRGDVPVNFSFDFAAAAVVDPDFGHAADFAAVEYRIRDIWQARNLASTAVPLSTTIAAHETLTLRLSR